MNLQEILKDVNSKVAEKEREQRFLEIYKGIDAKSSVLYQGKKFKKSDVLSSSRKLMFEGTAVLSRPSPAFSAHANGSSQNGPSSSNRSGAAVSGQAPALVTVVVLSDILFFLQENNGKYYFFAPEGKPSVVAVHTLLARERNGGSSKSLHLISTSEREHPEVFDLEIIQPPTRDDWISGIREAVDASYTPGEENSAEYQGRVRFNTVQ